MATQQKSFNWNTMAHGVITAVLTALVLGLGAEVVSARDSIRDLKVKSAEHSKELETRGETLINLRIAVSELAVLVKAVRK